MFLSDVGTMSMMMMLALTVLSVVAMVTMLRLGFRVCSDDDYGDDVIAKFDAELATLCSVPIHIYHANFEISESRFGDSNQHMFYVYSTNSP